MEINYHVNYSMEIKSCNIDYIIAAFRQLLPMLLTDFVSLILTHFADEAMSQDEKPFVCKCGNMREFIWKTKHAKTTKIMTIFGDLLLSQIQVQCKVCGKKMFISRWFLGIEKYMKKSPVTTRLLALVGALAPYRVVTTFFKLVGVNLNPMTIWRSVQEVGKTIFFDLDPNELPSGEADGTGIPIAGIKKRGMELKVFIQKKHGGGARIAGASIGRYDSGWDKLFAPLRATIMSFKKFLLVTDGDASIFKGMNCINVILQRCLWHIPHQLKFCLWRDKVNRKTQDWAMIMGKIFNITALRSLLKECEIEALLQEKRTCLDELISFCVKRNYVHCVTYLRNAQSDMFTALENRLDGKASSLVERVMKTVNMRVNVGKWTPSGALNAIKLRLAHYYNNWDPGEPKLKGLIINRI